MSGVICQSAGFFMLPQGVAGIGGTWDTVHLGSGVALSGANLVATSSTGNPTNGVAVGTGTSSGGGPVKAEFLQVSGAATLLGICNSSFVGGTTHWGFGGNIDTEYYQNDGTRYDFAGANAAFGASWPTGSTITMELDVTAGTCKIKKDGALQGTITGIPAGTWKFLFAANSASTQSVSANFSGPFLY